MSETNRGGVFVVGAVLLAAAVAAFFYLRQSREPDVVPAATVPAPQPAAVESPATPAHPIEDAVVDDTAIGSDALPLPALHESDALALEALLGLLGSDAIPAWLVPEFVIQRAVATIDNLPRAKIAPNVSVVKAVPGTLGTEGEGATRVLSAANQARYAPYVAAFESADAGALAANYVRLYPLFQQAYRELGAGDAYFNDRLVEVIDHLLAAPEVEPPIELVRPKVYWQFRDPSLESMSAGHKLMVRIGPDQSARVKARLRELRAALAAAAPREGAAVQQGAAAPTDEPATPPR